MLVESVQNVRWETFFDARHFSTLSQRKRVGMSHVAKRCAHDVVPWYSEHTGCRSELYPRTPSPPPPSDFAIECEVSLAFFIHIAVRPSPYSSCSAGSSVQELLGTESNIPRTSRHNVGFSVLYRPSTPGTCFVTSSALRPLVRTPAGLSLLGTFADCTAFCAFRLRTNKKWQFTCLSLLRPLRGFTPKGCAGVAVHDRAPRVSLVPDHRFKKPWPRRLPSPRHTVRTQPRITQ